jgi:hypothetical protein
MDSKIINTAVIVAIKGSVIPHVDKEKLVEIFGSVQGEALTAAISKLVREAVSVPIEWGNMTLEECANNILRRFSEKHPELSSEALHQIRRCVGWNLR